MRINRRRKKGVHVDPLMHLSVNKYLYHGPANFEHYRMIRTTQILRFLKKMRQLFFDKASTPFWQKSLCSFNSSLMLNY